MLITNIDLVTRITTIASTSEVDVTLVETRRTTTTVSVMGTTPVGCPLVKVAAVGGAADGKYWTIFTDPHYRQLLVAFGNAQTATIFALNANDDGTFGMIAPNGQPVAANLGFVITPIYLNPGLPAGGDYGPLVCNVNNAPEYTSCTVSI